MTSDPTPLRPERRRPRPLTVVALVFGMALALPLGGYLVSFASSQEVASAENPGSGYWRDVREGTSGYSAVSGNESGVLIQGDGQNWRVLRNDLVRPTGGWMILGVLVVIGVFFAIRGRVKIDGEPSGVLIDRWSLLERIMHWYTAILFVILGLTGLSLLFGRLLLLPLFGKEGFAGYAAAAKVVHDYLGPLFVLGVIAMLIVWARNALFRKGDGTWLKQMGGYLGKGKHPPSGRFNAGQKIWFWLAIVVGLIVSTSGYVLDFPNFGQTRETMQLWHLVHAVASVTFIAVALGHIYLGTLGTEGTFPSMIGGKVDATWAKQHHDLWYEDVASESKGGE